MCPSVSWCHHNYFPSTKHQIPPYLPSPPSNFLQNQTSSMTSGTIWSDLRVVFRQFLPADLVNRFLCKLPVVEVWHCDNHQQLFNLKTELFLNCKCRIIFLSSVSVTEMKYCDLKHVTLSVRCRARSSHHTSTNCYHLTPHTSQYTDETDQAWGTTGRSKTDIMMMRWEKSISHILIYFQENLKSCNLMRRLCLQNKTKYVTDWLTQKTSRKSWE